MNSQNFAFKCYSRLHPLGPLDAASKTLGAQGARCLCPFQVSHDQEWVVSAVQFDVCILLCIVSCWDHRWGGHATHRDGTLRRRHTANDLAEALLE
eukprot:3504609-Amphidinium_carterae.1